MISDELQDQATLYALDLLSGAEAAAFERELAQLPPSKFCYGDTPTLADCCLVPQIFNGRRVNTPYEGLPRTMAAYEACMEMPAFQKAQPTSCPDNEP